MKLPVSIIAALAMIIVSPAFSQTALPQPTAAEVEANYNFQLGQTLSNLGRIQAQNIQLQKQVDALKAQLAKKDDPKTPKKDASPPSP